MTPRHNYLLCKRVPTDYEGKIVGVSVGPPQAQVLAIGPEVHASYLIGGKVLFRSTSVVGLANDEFLVKDEDVIAICDD